LAALPIAIAANEVLAQSTWYAVRGVDNSFYVDMPGEPILQGDRHAIGRRRRPRLPFLTSLEYRRLSFVAQTALFHADVDVRQPKLNLQSVLDDRAQRLAAASGPASTGAMSRARRPLNRWARSGGSTLRQLVLLKGRR